MTAVLIILAFVALAFWLIGKICGGVWRVLFKPITDEAGDAILRRIMRAGHLTRKQARATVSAALIAIIAILVAIACM